MGIRRWLGKEFTLWIAAHPFRERDMVSLSGNGVGYSPENPSSVFRNEVEEMIFHIREKIISEGRSHFSLVMGQLEGLRKEVEIVRTTSNVIMMKIENLDRKVETRRKN